MKRESTVWQKNRAKIESNTRKGARKEMIHALRQPKRESHQYFILESLLPSVVRWARIQHRSLISAVGSAKAVKLRVSLYTDDLALFLNPNRQEMQGQCRSYQHLHMLRVLSQISSIVQSTLWPVQPCSWRGCSTSFSLFGRP